VLGVDDGEILHDTALQFESIDAIVKTASQVVLTYLMKHNIERVVLGGWSYGGVVAMKMAQFWHELSSINVGVEAVVLIDSPITPPRKVNEDKAPLLDGSSTARHFAYCTKLLQEYYDTPSPLVPCKLIDIRAEDSSYEYEDASELQKYTSKAAVRHISTGTHWTVISEENAAKVAKTLQLLLD